ncbi:MAG: hypothetical protein AMXMBFR83_02950 [Phycisphaerae bacterium]
MMGTTLTAQWSGLGFAPYSSPDLPSFLSEPSGAFVTEWSTGLAHEERRSSPRQAISCEVLMTDPTWCETENPLPVRGACLDVSEDGLHAVLPDGYGLAVGQRYVFRLRPFEGEPESVPLLGTIVRAEPLVRDGSDAVAIGVRLLGPARTV